LRQGRAETLNPCQQGAAYGRITILVDSMDQWVHSRLLTPLRCAPDQSRPDGGSPNGEHPLLPTVSTLALAIYPHTIHVPGEAPRPDPCSSTPVAGVSPGSVCTRERLILGGTPPFAGRRHRTPDSTPGMSPLHRRWTRAWGSVIGGAPRMGFTASAGVCRSAC
jgi:hypothetical protein